MIVTLLTALTLALAAPSGGSSLPLNAASAEQLAALPGVGEDTAAAIVALRGERGGLGSVEELRILGLGDAALDTLRASTSLEVHAPVEGGTRYRTVEEVMAAFADEPAILDVQRMAMEYTHTNREQVERWLSASKNAALLPELKLRYTYNNDTDLDYDYLSQTEFQYDQGGSKWGTDYRVELKWKLDELVMNSERIRVIGEAQDIVKLRDKVLGEVNRIYFDRRRLQTDLLLNPPSDLKGQLEDQLRLMELTAELDAYTGGRFSEALAN